MFTAKISLIFVKAFKNIAKNEGLERFAGNSSTVRKSAISDERVRYCALSTHSVA